jgi:hypothetical protein
MTGPWAWYSVSERMQMIPDEHDGDEVEVGDTSSSLMVGGLILSTCGIMGVVDGDWVGERGEAEGKRGGDGELPGARAGAVAGAGAAGAEEGPGAGAESRVADGDSLKEKEGVGARTLTAGTCSISARRRISCINAAGMLTVVDAVGSGATTAAGVTSGAGVVETGAGGRIEVKVDGGPKDRASSAAQGAAAEGTVAEATVRGVLASALAS